MTMSDSTSNLSVETSRLLLREFGESDVDNFLALESIPEVVRYQDYTPYTLKQAKKYVQNCLADQVKVPRQYVELAAIERETNTFVGRVGCKIKHKHHKADLWFSFMPGSQGKGYATEAVKALIPILISRLAVEKLEIECDPRNEGSKRLAERLGFEKVKEVEKAYECKGEWVGSVYYSRDASTF